jgi:hypothetical protein
VQTPVSGKPTFLASITGITLIAGFASTVGWPQSQRGGKRNLPSLWRMRCRSQRDIP